jgi:NTP pyrophosphatase (non-canonical NTP hydrolase)
MEELTTEITEFIKERDWDQFHSPENLAKCISIEAGELLECFQWGGKFDQKNAERELADVFIYCLQMADKLGVKPEDIIRSKMAENGAKYPVAKTKGNHKKYTEL